MLRKLIGYCLLSCTSFVFFLTLFHTVVNAQMIEKITPSATDENEHIAPTPTVFVQQSPTPYPFFGQKYPTAIPTSTPTPTPSPKPSITGNDLDSFFAHYSSEYHVDGELLKKIAKCESGFRANAQNGDYQGMFQFATQTWISTRGQMGSDTNPELRNNAEEAIRTAAYMIGLGRQNAWANCL